MRSWARKLCRATAVVLALAMLPVVSGTAQAADVAYNQKNQRLEARPNSGMPIASVSREITLQDGTYGWWTFPTSAPCQTYTGRILPGTYTWTDQLWPGVPSVGTYRHHSYLTEEDGGWSYHIQCDFQLSATGSYTWGSGLDPHF
ncbi:hypothetical protein RM555_25455 [Micromonospora sp. DSM 115977]|uniref:Uncharacterized protein n=1 Tax=Micromonospora reichwaldensis TaxID=3075516 RepID=A0ABU2X2E0_9ACTN|nr:hypothetical protein [Micromonospora sp. DSM 115977]MDT0532353.1 hypothetical protein [Micromonospora sp. DSM 115977]